MARSVLLFFLVLLGFFPQLTSALTPPWANQSESRSTPWGETSENRKENRENFFQSLTAGTVFSADANLQKEVTPREIPAQKNEHDKELEKIPWGAHRSIYPAEKFSHRLVWPVDGGRLSSGYGIRSGSFHEGLDLAAKEGTKIRAAAAGRVVFNGTLGTYGKVLVVYHGDGVSSVYAHNSSNLKLKGAVVKRGEVIAEVGQTGHAEGSHCHFEMRKDGQPINPLQFHFARMNQVRS